MHIILPRVRKKPEVWPKGKLAAEFGGQELRV